MMIEEQNKNKYVKSEEFLEYFSNNSVNIYYYKIKIMRKKTKYLKDYATSRQNRNTLLT